MTPVTLDLSVLAEPSYSSTGDGMAKALLEWRDKLIHPAPKERLELLAKQVTNLSDNQTLRAYALAYCFRKTLDHAIMFLSHGEFEPSWEELQFVIDRVATQPNSREEQVFSVLVFSWMCAWSDTRPLATIQEIHTSDHTIMKKYGVDGGLELGAMMRDKIRWKDSRTEWGLQIADMAAAVIGDATQNVASAAAQKPFVRVMDATCLTPPHALSIFTPHPSAPATYADKYQPLVDAMIAHRSRGRSR